MKSAPELVLFTRGSSIIRRHIGSDTENNVDVHTYENRRYLSTNFCSDFRIFTKISV